MKHQITLTTVMIFFLAVVSYSQSTPAYPQAFVSMDDYELLIQELKKQRSKSLISFDKFNEMKEDKNTIILDTRSREMYTLRHIEGAINLPFTEFSLLNLQSLIPNTDTRILIYCNNNFTGDQVHFLSKIGPSRKNKSTTMKKAESKPVMLALNIPTYINLYGYGYEKVFELDELVDVNDERLELKSAFLMK